LGEEIANQLELQNLTAVSFDYRLYPFVKSNLKNKIPTNIIYHTWDVTALEDQNFKELLINNTLF
jgi:hypothetical protein